MRGRFTAEQSASRHHGITVYNQVLDSIEPRARNALEHVLPYKWYSIAIMDELWCAVAECCFGDNSERVTDGMKVVGKYIADDNLNNIYRVALAMFGTPRRLFRVLPRMWLTYFNNIEIDLDISELERNRGLCHVRGLGGLSHIGPAASGWIEYALERVGAEHADVHEREYQNGHKSSSHLVYEIEWGERPAG